MPSPSRARGAALVVLLWALAWVRPAAAHSSSTAYSDVRVFGATLDYSVQIADSDLFAAVGVERDRPVTRDEVERGRERLFDWLLAGVHIEAAGAACPGSPAGLTLIDKTGGFFAAAHMRFVCPAPIAAARLRYDLFFDLDPRHQGIVRVRFGDDDEGREQVLRDGAREVDLRPLGALEQARQYLLLGVSHIVTGYDHVAFLFGLLALVGALDPRRAARQVLGTVTAFTIAHSITLLGAASGSRALLPERIVPAVVALLAWLLLVEDRPPAPRPRPLVRLPVALSGYALAALFFHLLPSLRPADPARLVEPAIALSILYVAVENLAVAEPRHRFLLTFCFGLVHGFGFASVLREIGLPERGLVLSLVSFNLGVELGQLGVVAAVLPLLSLASGRSPTGRPALDALFGALWCGAAFALLRAAGAPRGPLAVVALGVAPLAVLLSRRFGYEAVVRRGGSAVIGLLAVLWFVERTQGRVLVGGWLG